jgi:hypothetical protein
MTCVSVPRLNKLMDLTTRLTPDEGAGIIVTSLVEVSCPSVDPSVKVLPLLSAQTVIKSTEPSPGVSDADNDLDVLSRINIFIKF